MNYFVNENIFSLNSGTEFSAAKRIQLFKEHQVPAKMLTRNYNPQLVDDTQRIGLEPTDVLNMYNYFQEVTDVAKQDVDVRYTEVIDKNTYQIEGVDPNESKLNYHGRTIGKVLIAPATVGLVGAFEYYNEMNDTVAKDIWDRRGFKSSTQYYHPDGQEGPQVFFDLTGKPKIEKTRMNINGDLHTTMYKLLDYKGRAWRFNSENEFFGFFMNELAQQEPSVFINDRPSLINEVAGIKNAVGKWQYLHNAHEINTAQRGGSNKVFDYMEPLFKTHMNDFDGVIVPTQTQAKEITKFFGFHHVAVLWDTFSEPHEPKAATERDKNKVIFTGRISPEKQPAQAIEVFAHAKTKRPDLQLEFYGYSADEKLNQTLADLAAKLGVSDAVHYNGYQNASQFAEKIADAAAMISVSMTEGFGDNILEAMSYGIPVVAYDVKYGIAELLDKTTGATEPLNASEPLGEDLANLLADENDAKWQTAIEQTHAKAQEFNEEHAWQQWETTQAKIKNLFVK
ncbi:glycosyltransferase [Furfurilactobacillus curtus]|uniref:Glycosyl transferase family 1 n=1 Tax=Furfurilactobacillus curtus TaxID=1746200 RepID=A0ABQ5JPW2_9LACO